MKTWITYKRKLEKDGSYSDPIIDGLLSNYNYNNPINELEFIGLFETLEQAIVNIYGDYNIQIIDDINDLLDIWYENVYFDGEKIIDNREVVS